VRIEKIVHKYILEEDPAMDLALSAGRPTDVLDYLKAHPLKSGLYFLDVDLQSEMNGIELGAKIRELDTSATIVFITTHTDKVPLVFRYKVEAMDYILKDQPQKIEARTRECIHLAYQRYLNGNSPEGKHFVVKTGDQVLNVPYAEILFFETHPTIRHKLILHTATERIEFRGFIKDVENLGPEFCQCHKSFCVNIKKIKRVDRTKLEIEMSNGEIIPISTRRMTEFLDRIEKSTN